MLVLIPLTQPTGIKICIPKTTFTEWKVVYFFPLKHKLGEHEWNQTLDSYHDLIIKHSSEQIVCLLQHRTDFSLWP